MLVCHECRNLVITICSILENSIVVEKRWIGKSVLLIQIQQWIVAALLMDPECEAVSPKNVRMQQQKIHLLWGSWGRACPIVPCCSRYRSQALSWAKYWWILGRFSSEKDDRKPLGSKKEKKKKKISLSIRGLENEMSAKVYCTLSVQQDPKAGTATLA